MSAQKVQINFKGRTGPVVIAGRYELIQELGRGGVGEVLLAQDLQLERLVAVKRISIQMGERAQRARVALGEAKQLARLQHPNIVTVFDVLDHEGDVLTVMEYLVGTTLGELAAPLLLNDFLSVARQSLTGLAAAHAIGMIHLDIKATNLMLTWLSTGQFHVKLLDFGLATMLGQAASDEEDDGSIVGSVYTMAPEQFERGPVDARTDLYSLGCVFYYALTLKDPFRGATVEEMIDAHLNHELRPLALRRPDLPPPLCLAVEKMMSRHPDARPASAVDALAELLGSLTPGAGKIREARDGDRLPPGDAPPHPTPVDEISLPDVARLKDHVGRKIAVHGVVRRVWDNAAGTIRFLNFDDIEHTDFSAVLSLKGEPAEFSSERLKALIGKKIRIAGVVSEFHGSPQILVDSPAQISPAHR